MAVLSQECGHRKFMAVLNDWMRYHRSHGSHEGDDEGNVIRQYPTTIVFCACARGTGAETARSSIAMGSWESPTRHERSDIENLQYLDSDHTMPENGVVHFDSYSTIDTHIKEGDSGYKTSKHISISKKEKDERIWDDSWLGLALFLRCETRLL